MKKPPVERIDVASGELEALVESVREPLGEAGYQKLHAAIRTLAYVTAALEKKEATLASLRRLLCQVSTEKTEKVLRQAGAGTGGKKPAVPDAAKNKAPGHGRNGAAAYRGARKVQVPHESLKTGDSCPDTQCDGKVYVQRDPGVLVRIKGQAPIAATVYELEKLRCNLCGTVYTAEAPQEAGAKKYDETAASAVAVLRYGSGFPWYRLEKLEESFGIPLPMSTQCEIVAETAAQLQPAMDELTRQAAQGELVHNDDTSMRVLSLGRNEETGEDNVLSTAQVGPERKGVFTSGLIWICQAARIALFFTGRKHAGENLGDVIKQRGDGLDPPIQMCDASSRNVPKLAGPLKTIVANCMAHGRRKFVDVAANFPEQCQFVLEAIGEVYGYDEQARERGLPAEARLAFHRERSGPVMEKLHVWLKTQLDEKIVEPNSGLGKVIAYLLKHWEKLTLFLRKAGAPLDNNIVERALKKAIMHRKNSLFYKNLNGAKMGDLFMSLIHTCELNGANPFDYLTELQRHAAELKSAPAEWMPWNYRTTMERLAKPAAA